MKQALSILVICALMLSAAVFPVSAAAPVCSARAYVLYCPQNGEIILSENKDMRLPMASTTKVMTALLTLEEAGKNDRVVTFTEEMTAEGSSMYLESGEQVRLSDLCIGMLMQSGNDAANAAAIAIDGSIARFADRMNIRASELGMKNTHFVTPSGLDGEDHYSTAYDMALLLCAAMENDTFRDITKQTAMTVDFISPEDKRVTYRNHNKLLRLYEYCIGGKTGYTDEAGRCLVSCAERDGVELICVTLDDPDDWDDHIRLFDYGFETLSPLMLGEEYRTVSAVCADGYGTTLTCEPQTIVSCNEVDVKEKLFLPDFIYAPLKKGEKIGEVICTAGEEAYALPLLAAEDVG